MFCSSRKRGMRIDFVGGLGAGRDGKVGEPGTEGESMMKSN